MLRARSMTMTPSSSKQGTNAGNIQYDNGSKRVVANQLPGCVGEHPRGQWLDSALKGSKRISQYKAKGIITSTTMPYASATDVAHAINPNSKTKHTYAKKTKVKVRKK